MSRKIVGVTVGTPISPEALKKKMNIEQSPDGDVDLTGVVKSVNGEEPDENGNVEIPIPKVSITPTFSMDVSGNQRSGVCIKAPMTVNEDGTVESNEGTVWDGKDGITPHIGENGNWFIGEKDTGVHAGGSGSGDTALPPLMGTTGEISPSQVFSAFVNGQPVMLSHTEDGIDYLFSSFNLAGSPDVYSAMIFSTIVGLTGNFDQPQCDVVMLVGSTQGRTWNVMHQQLPVMADVPTDEYITSLIEAELKNHPGSGGNVDYVGVEPACEDIPKIFFGGALQQTKDEAVVPFRYISKTDDFSGYAEIKAQGNSSMNYPKKNQTVKMFADEACDSKMKKDFKGWGKQNKHVYKANWIDLTHARNVVSARLWGDVVKSRSNYAELPELLRTAPNQGAVDGFPVKVYAAGVYQGRYTLNIPKDAWMANMDKDLDTHCILCGENYVSGCFRAAANINESDWTDEIHDVVPASIKTRWNQVISFVMNSTDEEFRANLSQYFYVDSLIDYYLFGLASCGLDAFGKNQLYMTYDGQKWIATMYDMDSTWGLYWNGSKFVSTSYGRNEFEDMSSGRQGNLLYIRLEQLFWSELQTRWAELKDGALSITNIINRFERFTDIASAELVKEDCASTTGSGKFTGIPSKDTNNIQQIRAFALARQAWTDEYVAGLSASEPEEPDIPEEPIVPDSEPLYSLAEAKTFNGTSDYIDTGVQLAKEDIDFSIVFHAIAGTGNASSLENCIFHCVNEERPYPGYAFCARNDNASYKCGADCVNYYTSIPLNDAEFKVVITHTSGVAGVTMKYLYNGNVGTSTASSAPKIVSVTQNLLIGCYQTVDGTKGRFWNGTLHDFKLYNCVLSDDEISAYLT